MVGLKVCCPGQRYVKGADYLCFDLASDALRSPCNYNMQLDFSREKTKELSITAKLNTAVLTSWRLSSWSLSVGIKHFYCALL